MNTVQQNTFVKVSTLQMIEMVFAGIEQSQMQIVPASRLTAEIQNKLDEFRKNDFAQSGQDAANLQQTEARLFNELELWRKSLVERDREFTAFDLRSFCSNAVPQFENEVYAALAGFYRNLTPDVLVLSKFDYVITQYFSVAAEDNRRVLRTDSEKIVSELRRLNSEWNDNSSSQPSNQSQIREAIFALSKLSVQAKTHKTLKSWLENEFFNYSREIKRELGNVLFVPEVATAVVLCNLTLGNHFATLCEADSAMLNNAAGMLATDKNSQEIISTQLNSSFKTLIHSGLEEDFAETLAHERLSNLFSLISGEEIKNENLITEQPLNQVDSQVSDDLAENQNEIAEGVHLEQPTQLLVVPEPKTVLVPHLEAEDPQNYLNELDFIEEPPLVADSHDEAEEDDVTVVAQSHPKLLSAFENVLNQLEQVHPDKTVIRNYLEKSSTPEIRRLRFETFLNIENKTDDKNLRRVLKLIVNIEKTIEFAKSGADVGSTEFQNELHFLNEEIQSVNNYLRTSLQSGAGLPKSDDNDRKGYLEALLYASNTLVEIQIRLNSATAPRQKVVEAPTSNEISAGIPKDDSDQRNIESLNYDQTKSLPFTKFKVNKLLLFAAAAIVLFGGGLLVFNLMNAETSVTNANVQTLDPKMLRGGNHLLSAKVNKNTLFGFAGNDWSSQTPEQKRDNLKLLLEEGSKNGFNKILIIGQNGDLLGNASEAEIKVF